MHYDISPVLSSETAVFPGDVAFERQVQMSFEAGQHMDLSAVKTTLHIGAHADAPSHYSGQGQTIENRSLHFYMGNCQVVSVNIAAGKRILETDVNLSLINEKRVLFKTNSFPNPNQWNNDFNSLSPALIKSLKGKGVCLVGIDTPSIDPWDSKDLESHKQIPLADMAVLEGIVLKDVPDGVYKLIALPLPFKGGDASPVRAVLIPPQDWERL